MNVLGKTLTFTQNPSFQFTLYILCESPKCPFSNLKLCKLCKYLIGKHAMMAIDCCTGSRQQNPSTITDWQNSNKESNAAA